MCNTYHVFKFKFNNSSIHYNTKDYNTRLIDRKYGSVERKFSLLRVDQRENTDS